MHIADKKSFTAVAPKKSAGFVIWIHYNRSSFSILGE